MKNKQLVIICTKYPYTGGEPFIDNEISMLLTVVDRVLIYPIGTKKTDTKLFVNLPQGVVLRNLCIGDIKTKSILRMFLQLFKRNTWNEIKNSRKEGQNTIKKILYTLLYETQISITFDAIKNDLLKYIDKNDYLCIYSYWMHNHAAVAWRLKAEYPNSFFITRCHGYDLYDYRAPFNYLPERNQILKNVDEIFAISDNGKKYLESKYPYIVGKISVSYLGTKDFGLAKDKKDHNFFRIISCSNLVALKRIDFLIDALSMIKDYNIEWFHFGDGNLFLQLKSQADSELGKNIKYHFMGHVDNIELMRYYANIEADLFVNVSEFEGLPVSIMEAMSFGIPVIATNVGGTSEIVEDGYNGWLIDKKVSSKELSKIILDAIVLDEETRFNLKNNARKTWKTKFNSLKNSTNFVGSINQLFNDINH